ncbi:hypothetical protein MITS9509_03550 [Synechococcus sp. MIT S9509]|nr:hypothetical protein MITS9509_03550 [Synechococcus sp. MIT S9509]
MRNSSINFSGDRVNISAYAQGNNPYAIGMDNSNLYLKGRNDKTLTINAHSRLTGNYDPSWGLRQSQVITGNGNDLINITTSAKAVNWRARGDLETTGLERSYISTGFGNDSICLNNHAEADDWDAKSKATGMRGSIINLGSGENVITANIKANHKSFGRLSEAKTMDQSTIRSGGNNDYIGLSATADNYRDTGYSRNYNNNYAYNRTYSHSSNLNYSRRSWWGRSSYKRSYENQYSYSYKYSNNYNRNIQRGYGRSATAITLDNQSAIITNSGDDQVFLNAFAKGGTNDWGWWYNRSNTSATVIKEGLVDLGLGDDELGINAESNGTSTGGFNTQISLGKDYSYGHQDNDVLEISALASDLKFDSTKYLRSYESSYSSVGSNAWNSSYNSRWWGSTISNGFNSWNNSSNTTSSYSYERVRTFAGNDVSAIGLKNSVVTAGYGNDIMNIDAKAERTASSNRSSEAGRADATGIQSTLIDAGAGNDILSIKAEASSLYQNTNQSSYQFESKYSYSNQSESSYQRSRYGRSYANERSWDYDRSGRYANDYNFGYDKKEILSGEAYAVDSSSIVMGLGNDQASLTSNDIVARDSSIDLGVGDDRLTFHAESNSSSTGGSNTQISLGRDYSFGHQDSDVLKISALASDLKFDSTKSSSSSESSYSSAGTNAWNFSYNSRWWGSTISNGYNSWGNSSDTTSSYTYEQVRTFAGNDVSAIGLKNSVVTAGYGNDIMNIDAKAERTAASNLSSEARRADATGIHSTLIDAGAGNDILSINAEASSLYQNTNQRSSQFEHNYSYSNQGESSYQRSRYGRSYANERSWDYDHSGEYTYGYNYSHDKKEILRGDACAVDSSSLVMGLGNDQASLTSNDIVARDSSIDLGFGDDVLTMNGDKLAVFQNSAFIGGSGRDRLVLSGFSSQDLDSLSKEFSFDPITKIVTLGSSEFQGFEQVQLGDDLFNVATDFVESPRDLITGTEVIETQFQAPNELNIATSINSATSDIASEKTTVKSNLQHTSQFQHTNEFVNKTIESQVETSTRRESRLAQGNETLQSTTNLNSTSSISLSDYLIATDSTNIQTTSAILTNDPFSTRSTASSAVDLIAGSDQPLLA